MVSSISLHAESDVDNIKHHFVYSHYTYRFFSWTDFYFFDLWWGLLTCGFVDKKDFDFALPNKFYFLFHSIFCND